MATDICSPAGRVSAATARQGSIIARSLDIEAGGEGAVAGAGQDDDADFRVDGELAEHATQLKPHSFVEGVELGRAVDLDVSDERGRARDAEMLEARVGWELGHGDDCGLRCASYYLQIQQMLTQDEYAFCSRQ